MSFALANDHFTDISAVVDDLEKRFPGMPLFLIGTSRGTISAAALGARFGQRIAGAVLTATMFRQAPAGIQNEPGPGLSRFDFATIKSPLLFVHHVSDQCASTPYGDAARLSERYPLITVFGGSAAAVGALRRVQPAWLSRQGIGNRRANRQLDAEETISLRSEIGVLWLWCR